MVFPSSKQLVWQVSYDRERDKKRSETKGHRFSAHFANAHGEVPAAPLRANARCETVLAIHLCFLRYFRAIIDDGGKQKQS